jgi:hypothetical protein
MSLTIIRGFTRSLPLVLGVLFAAGPAAGQPAWTDFSYTDWNPGTDPALKGWDYESRLYESRAAWDGSRFVSILSYEAEEVSPADYRFAYSSDGRNWSAGTETETINMPRAWSVSHHTLACDPDCFPATDVYWADQSQNVKFKMWYCHSGYFFDFRYAESTDGRHWEAALEPDYCPPTYKQYDWTPTTRIMIKPDVLYRPTGSTTLDISNPMNNRYIFYSGASTIDTGGGSGFFEMYISSNGLDWKLYAWDSQCQGQWDAWTDAPSEVSHLLTFTGGLASSSLYVDSIEEVYENGERRGFLLWVDRYTTNPSIQSYYSTNGFDWISREQPINTIGDANDWTSDITVWNYQRNYGLDAVRLGESYFITRAGRSESQHYNTGAAIVKGPMSAEADTPASPSSGNVAIDYRLFHWNAETCPDAEFTFSTDGANWISAAAAGGESAPYLTGIGGYPHAFTWNSLSDLPGGAPAVYFRVQPVPAAETGSYDTTAPFAVSQTGPSPTAPLPSPTLPLPSPTAIPPTPTAIPPTPTTAPSPAPSPSATSASLPTPSPAPTPRHLVIDAADYDGDGTADCGLWRGDDGTFRIRDLSLVYYGMTGDIPVSGDYGGDGSADYAIWRPSSGKWSMRGLSNGANHYYGQNGDIPAPADYDGDFRTDTALYRPSIGKWFIRGQTTFYYGLYTDLPIPGDYNGDGTADPALFRPFPGGAGWYIRHLTLLYYGQTYDLPVPGDYNGDGTTELSVFRPSFGRWYVRGVPYVVFGQADDIPFAFNYDGDATAERALYRPGQGRWLIYGLTSFYFGSAGDQPISGKSY